MQLELRPNMNHNDARRTSFGIHLDMLFHRLGGAFNHVLSLKRFL
jgi:hypothetical protein